MMKTDEALALVRNPWGHSEALVWEARITVCDRLEAAERYAVEWEQLARQYRDKRDALAAHVDRWHDAYVDLTNNLMTLDGVAHYVADNAMMRRFDELDESAPATSLARHDADLLDRWSARLMCHEVDARDSGWPVRDASTILKEGADELRRQAEEEPNG